VPVTVKVYVPVFVCGFEGPEQPAKTTNRTMAVTIPSRERSRRVFGNRNNKIIAKTSGTTCRQDTGGVGTRGGGITIAVDVTVSVDVKTGGVIEAGFGVQVDKVSVVGSMQVRATAELNPPLGVMVTV
jgi:hypothetical protein